ncbi:MAG TPA: hypothetical protein VND54_04735 [Candidatus Saccharimonadales bacterium]|nr:hypothetical protein [Candidatus Saccharimonadales bacterium]
MNGQMFWYGDGWSWWQPALMWGGMLVFWGLVIWGVYAVVTARRRPAQAAPSESAVSILQQRLARGEIDSDEFRRVRVLLESPGPTSLGAGDRP